MIYYFIAYSLAKNIGASYNECMQMLPDDEDWACLMDGDTIVLTKSFQKQIQEIINNNPHVGLITCMTNRVGNRSQLYKERISENLDIEFHQQIADKLEEIYYGRVKRVYKNISGLLMLVKKRQWKRSNGFRESGMISVDSVFSRKLLRLKQSIIITTGIYCYHWYRGRGGKRNIEHLRR